MDLSAPLDLLFILLVLLMITAAYDDAERHQAQECGDDFLCAGHGLTSAGGHIGRKTILLGFVCLDKMAWTSRNAPMTASIPW
jgi:hypothetical protein